MVENDAPYTSSGENLSFVGRQDALSRLHQHLAAPTLDAPLTYMARTALGKTTLLKHIVAQYSHWIVVYVPLGKHAYENESDLFRHLAQYIVETAAERGLDTQNITLPTDTVDVTWLTANLLPGLYVQLAADIHFLLLLDQVEALYAAIQDGTLQESVLTQLATLHTSEMPLVNTLDLQYEDHIDFFSPLIHGDNIFRLKQLTNSEAAALLHQIAGDTLDEDVIATLLKLTGGEPTLLQNFGHLLYTTEMRPGQFTAKQIKKLIPTAVEQSSDFFTRIWHGLNQPQRYTLRALSALQYTDPLGPIQPEALEAWLIQSEHPLDATAISAALRSLVYQDIIYQSKETIRFSAGLTHIWLLDDVDHLTEVPVPVETTTPRWLIVVAIAVAAAAFALIGLLSQTNNDSQNAATAVPTLPLSQPTATGSG